MSGHVFKKPKNIDNFDLSLIIIINLGLKITLSGLCCAPPTKVKVNEVWIVTPSLSGRSLLVLPSAVRNVPLQLPLLPQDAVLRQQQRAAGKKSIILTRVSNLGIGIDFC